MIGGKHPQPDAELEPRSALGGLLNSIACLCVLGRDIVCVIPKKHLALAVAQHEGNKTDGIVRMAKGLGSFEKITGHDETRRVFWDSMVAPWPTVHITNGPHRTE